MRIPALNSFVGVLIFFLLFCALVGSAHAKVDVYAVSVVVTNESNYNIQTLYDYLATHGQVDTILYNDSENPTVWYMNRGLGCTNSTFTVSAATGCTELRIGTTNTNTFFGYNTGSNMGFVLDGVKIVAWNFTSDSPETNISATKPFYLDSGHINNTFFDHCNYVWVLNCADQSFDNITYYNSYSSIRFDRLTNCTVSNVNMSNINQASSSTGYTFRLYQSLNNTIHDIIIYNTTKYGMDIDTCNYTTLYNINIQHTGNYLSQNTGHESFMTLYTNYTTAHDIYLDDSGWSTFCPQGRYNNMWNITARNTGHNCFDGHSTVDSVFENVTLWAAPNENYTAAGLPVSYKDTNTMILTGGYYTSQHAHNVTLRNVKCYNSPISFTTAVHNITVENLTLEGDLARDGAFTSSGNYTTLKNITLNVDPAYKTWEKLLICKVSQDLSNNVSIIDSNLYKFSAEYGFPTRVVNSEFSIFGTNNHTTFYYLDVAIKDANGSPLDGSITPTNINDTSWIYAPVDGNGENKESFETTAGRTYLPAVNRGESGAIADTWKLNSATTNFEHNLTVETVSGNVLLDCVNPDSRWYRSNPANSTYTITALINDSETLHFTGYAPTPEYNNFDSGDSVKFQIWTNEPLTSVTWKKDGQTLQTGGMTYEATISDVPITVDILGESASGSISKTWIVDPTPPEEPNSSSLIPVANFTSNATSGTYPMWISFSDESENTPTRWYWDFDNDGVIDSRLENPVYKYKTAGNYTVKLTVANDAENGIDSVTKTAYITVTGATPTKSITHSIYGYFYNIFYRIFYLGAWL